MPVRCERPPRASYHRIVGRDDPIAAGLASASSGCWSRRQASPAPRLFEGRRTVRLAGPGDGLARDGAGRSCRVDPDPDARPVSFLPSNCYPGTASGSSRSRTDPRVECLERLVNLRSHRAFSVAMALVQSSGRNGTHLAVNRECPGVGGRSLGAAEREWGATKKRTIRNEKYGFSIDLKDLTVTCRHASVQEWRRPPERDGEDTVNVAPPRGAGAFQLAPARGPE